MENKTPNDLIISREYASKTKATTTKGQSDYNASFVLSVQFIQSVKKWDKVQGKYVDSDSHPFYLKWQNQKTEDVYQILKKANELAKRYNNIKCSKLYLNLNKGWRVNSFIKKQGLELQEVQNIHVRTYGKSGNCIWTMPDNFMLEFPKLIPEDVTLEKLNIYHDSIVSKTKHVSEEQAQAIYEYLKYYYLSNEPTEHPYKPTGKEEEFYNFKTQNEITEFCDKKMSQGATAETMRTFWKEQNAILVEKNKFLSMIAGEEAPAPKTKVTIEKILELKTSRVPHSEICKKLDISKSELNEFLNNNK